MQLVVSGLNDSTPLQLFGLLKLIRVLRLGRIIRYLNVKDDLKMVKTPPLLILLVSKDR